MREDELIADIASDSDDDAVRSERVMEDSCTDSNKIRNVHIEQLDHGYIVTIGCQKFAIETRTSLLINLQKYLENPSNTEHRWMSLKDYVI